MAAAALAKNNDKLRVHIVCSGFLYGNGEQNDIFYEFFRRAWVSLHPQLSALPVIAKGENNLPTIHVSDLAASLDLILLHGADFSTYLLAVDQSQESSQRELMTTISEGIGSGATQDLEVSDVINEPWCEFLNVDVKLETSQALRESVEWKCPSGINAQTMAMLNEEFNYFRGLFPLKVFYTGPPCAGKTYLAGQLSDEYGIPHLTIKGIIDMGLELKTEYGEGLRAKILELTEQAEADYEKTRKKKDPDFDRATYKPRLGDDVLQDLVKIQLSGAACQNKGFILDGFPRGVDDAKSVFMDKIEIKTAQVGEDGAEEEAQYEEKINQKIVPQYAIALEGDDASLVQRAKDLAPEAKEGTHHDDAGMGRRLKEYRGRNPEGDSLKEFFTQAIGYPNVLVVDSGSPTED